MAQGIKLHPGSDITVSGQATPTLAQADDNSGMAEALAAAIRPGLTVSVPGMAAARPGSDAVDGVLDELVHGIGAEVAHGVSITRDPVTAPSLQLEGGLQDEQPETETIEVRVVSSFNLDLPQNANETKIE
jgi:hypothetical protein